MSESSSRILIDRTVVRVDGRPFFAFGPRVLLTPVERYPATLLEIAAAGFTAVATPPCSPGTTAALDTFFDAAENTGLMVLLMADPRLPEHGRYLADHFRHRPSLLGYMLPQYPGTAEGLESYIRERDAIRASDIFHPIMMPLGRDHMHPQWLRQQDMLIPRAPVESGSSGRSLGQRWRPAVDAMYHALRERPSRPCITTDLRTMASDEERGRGVFDDDPAVRQSSRHSIDWFPYLANLGRTARRDLLVPDPETIRLQVYEQLSAGIRGIFLDFLEGLQGTSPFTGRDRFLEAGILAQEIAALQSFFAEGILETVPVETGHPRLGASVLRHGTQYLILLRMEGYEDEYFVDEGVMERTEVELALPASPNLRAWRVDYPTVSALDCHAEGPEGIRIRSGPVELTGLVLLSEGTRRAEEISWQLDARLPLVARLAVELLSVRLAKVAQIERELSDHGHGIDNRERLQLAQKELFEAREAAGADDFSEALMKARFGCRVLRQAIKYQMARALATPLVDKRSRIMQLRNSYYTLPRFYRELSLETARAYMDLT